MLKKQEKRRRRHRKIRAKVVGRDDKPRLCVFRSNRHIYVQVINDEKGHTLVSASDLELSPERLQRDSKKNNKNLKNRKVALAFEVGRLIAEKALKKGIKRIVFDRGGYRYHGRVKAVAEGAREGGLEF